MKKVIFILLFSSFCGYSFTQQLVTSTEADMVHNVVRKYCDLLADYTKSKSNAGLRLDILDLFPPEVDILEKVVDDLATFNMVSINTYLKKIASPDELNYEVKLTFPDDIEEISVRRAVEYNHTEKSNQILYGIITVNKLIILPKTTPLKVDNIFKINLKNAKIGRIISSKSKSEQLYVDASLALAVKDYSKALDMFVKAAELGNLEAMYQAGYMYFTNIGCKDLSRKDRVNRGYHWLCKAARRYSPNVIYDYNSPISLSRLLLDKLGYEDECND